MKTSTLLTIGLVLAAGIIAPLFGTPPNLLERRVALVTAKTTADAEAAAAPADTDLAAVAASRGQDLTAFDTGNATLFGADWMTRWQNSSHENPDDEAIDIYIGGTGFPWGGFHCCSRAKQLELLNHIAAKPSVTATDLLAVKASSITNPAIVSRLEDFAAHLPSGGVHNEEYYTFKHIELFKKPGNRPAFIKHMTTAEWFDLASANAHFSTPTFAAMRNHLLAHTSRLLIAKRRAAGQTVEGPEFDAALAPVVDALKTPKFNGLAAAVTALGIDLTIPSPDYTAQDAVAAAVEFAANNQTTFNTAWGTAVPYPDGLGSVMFIKGEAAYTAWRNMLINSN